MNVFKKSDLHSHMPFLFEDKLLFCTAQLQDRIYQMEGVGRDARAPKIKTPYQAYRLAWMKFKGKDKTIHDLASDMGLSNVACNPSAWRDDKGLIHVTFTSALTSHRADLIYRLWEKVGKDFSSLGDRKMLPLVFGLKPYSAFENSEFRAVANSRIGNAFFIYASKNDRIQIRVQLPNIKWLRRISYMSEDHSKFLLTYPYGPVVNKSYNQYKTVIYDTQLNFCREIKIDGEIIYKSTIIGEIGVYSKNNSTPDKYYMNLVKGRVTYHKSNVICRPKIIKQLTHWD